MADFPLDALCYFLDLLPGQHRRQVALDHPSGAFSRRPPPPIGVADAAPADKSDRLPSSNKPTVSMVIAGPDEKIPVALALRLRSTRLLCCAFQSGYEVLAQEGRQWLGQVGFKHAHDLAGPKPVGAALQFLLQYKWRRHVDHNNALVVAWRHYGTIRHGVLLDDQVNLYLTITQHIPCQTFLSSRPMPVFRSKLPVGARKFPVPSGPFPVPLAGKSPRNGPVSGALRSDGVPDFANFP